MFGRTKTNCIVRQTCSWLIFLGVKLITKLSFLFPDKTEHCDKLTLPVLRLKKGRIKLSGHVGGKKINHWKKVIFAGQVTKTFVQTDKYLYKPGQDVQFRILTLSGPFLKISTNQVKYCVWYCSILVLFICKVYDNFDISRHTIAIFTGLPTYFQARLLYCSPFDPLIKLFICSSF